MRAWRTQATGVGECNFSTHSSDKASMLSG
jgi:hypothetical protein